MPMVLMQQDNSTQNSKGFATGIAVEKAKMQGEYRAGLCSPRASLSKLEDGQENKEAAVPNQTRTNQTRCRVREGQLF